MSEVGSAIPGEYRATRGRHASCPSRQPASPPKPRGQGLTAPCGPWPGDLGRSTRARVATIEPSLRHRNLRVFAPMPPGAFRCRTQTQPAIQATVAKPPTAQRVQFLTVRRTIAQTVSESRTRHGAPENPPLLKPPSRRPGPLRALEQSASPVELAGRSSLP